MPEINEKDLNRLLRLWAEISVRQQEIGKILLKQPSLQARLEARKKGSAQVMDSKMGLGEMELTAVVRRPDKSIRKTQHYKYKIGDNGEGVLKQRVIKEG